MKRKLSLLLFVIAVSVLVPAGAFAEETAPTAATLAKVMTPALSKKFDGQVVTFDASFNSVMEQTLDLPVKYHKGYVRAILMDGTVSCMNVLIPTDISEPLFDIPNGEKITWVAKVIAGTVPMSFGQKTVYLVVESFKKAEAPAAQPQTAPVTQPQVVPAAQDSSCNCQQCLQQCAGGQ